MAKIQPVWAIDIGQAALKALKLAPGADKDHVVAQAFDYVEYPKILSQPDADSEALVKEALQTFLERNDLKGSKVAIGVAGQAGLVKFIKLPPVEKKRIPDIVKFEARQQIPFALEEVIWDYQQIGGDDDADEGFAMAEVGLFAMKRDQIGRAIFPIQAAGIEVDVVQMGPIALYNFATFDAIKPEDKDKGSVVLVDIGADNTDLIITDGQRIWQRNVPIGGNHFTRALTKELKLTFAKAEHLKRNATKAPDPRAVFTAMRGVFNDFASEVNRSIGFYSSVNRTAKIAKVIGLGNGFKLPGLQKFLQQNLAYEVEKLEGFQKLMGDEVKGAPQFVENLPSFAVAYGLGIQGLGRSRLRTNLIPPEVEQVRMIRRKKPWALAAASLVAAGVLVLAASDIRANNKANSPEFNSPVGAAKAAATQGGQQKTAFDSAKGEFQATAKEGEALIPADSTSAGMGTFLRTIEEALIPDPTIDPRDGKKLNPDLPGDRQVIDRIRVHIDAIRPVWESDLGRWYDGLRPEFKNVMHPYDRDPKNKPTGEGWIVQVVGHHFNPRPRSGKGSEDTIKGIDLGPLTFLNQRVLPRLGRASYRQFGFNHATYSWTNIDDRWTGDKGASFGPPNAPVLARNTTAPVAAAGATTGGGAAARPSAMAIPLMNSGAQGRVDITAIAPYGAAPGRGVPGAPEAGRKAAQTRTRTEFKLELIWKPSEKPQTEAEVKKEVEKITADLLAAEKNLQGVVAPPGEAEFAKLSNEATAKALQDTSPQPGAATAPGAVAPPASAVPPPAAAPGAVAPPASAVPRPPAPR